MRKYIWLVLAAAVLVGGCSTTKSSGHVSEVIGDSVRSVISEYEGHRIRYFDPNGKALRELPAGQAGSVSIYNKEVTGQDNYIFGKDGVIKKHLRSYGEDYPKGKWKEVR